uniref:F180B protein n=1 Tax=Dromaius novaehollandiae TaxID=8790 RepID=A0A8C4JE81_DRONO
GRCRGERTSSPARGRRRAVRGRLWAEAPLAPAAPAQPAWRKSQALLVCAAARCLEGAAMLWAGLEIEANAMVRLQDEELASLHPARQFLHILQNEVPKTPTEIEQQLRYYSLTDTPLPVMEFDRLLFTSVYCAYQIRSIQGLDKNLWISLFSQLVDEIFRDLCKGFCPGVSTDVPAEFILDNSVLPPYIHSVVSAECSIFSYLQEPTK